MEDNIKDLLTGLLGEDTPDGMTKEEAEMDIECMLEAMASDDAKISAMGQSITTLCTLEKFTPFEVVSLSATLLVTACCERARVKGIESTNRFFEHMMHTVKETYKEVIKELEDDKCEDGDCSCECE